MDFGSSEIPFLQKEIHGVSVCDTHSQPILSSQLPILHFRGQLENLEERQGEGGWEKKKLWLYFYSLNSSPL